MKHHLLVTYTSGYVRLYIIESDINVQTIMDEIFEDCEDIEKIQRYRIDEIMEIRYPA